MTKPRSQRAAMAAMTGLAAMTMSYSTGCHQERGIFTEPIRRAPVSLENIGTLRDMQPMEISNSDTRYADAEVIIHGKTYNVSPNIYREKNEGEHILKKHEDQELMIERDNGKVSIHSDDMVYIPTLVLKNDGTPATTFWLNPEGEYGLRAKIKKYDVEGIETGVLVTNQKDVEYIVGAMDFGPYGKFAVPKRMTIREKIILEEKIERGYFEIVKDMPANEARELEANLVRDVEERLAALDVRLLTEDENMLGHYEAPVPGMKIGIKKDTGLMRLIVPKGIFELKGMTVEEYENRAGLFEHQPGEDNKSKTGQGFIER